MWHILVIFSALCAYFVDSSTFNPGPKYPPTKGEVWPKPQEEKKENTFFTFYPTLFEVKLTNQNCSTLTNAVFRTVSSIRHLNVIATRHLRKTKGKYIRHTALDNNYQGNIRALLVDLTARCEEYPQFDMDESYNLTVSSIAKLKSASIWGIIRGLETFSQLFYLSDDYTELRINSTKIVDFPRYPHRGLLLDTSRHYISLPNILRTLDAMAMNKLNVFHWHMVDDQSFPYQSERFPELSKKGAFHTSMVYTMSDIQTIVQYAKNRGIRILPEFDTPGHTRSWGEAYPEILTKCYDPLSIEDLVTGLGPMNPIKNATYKFLRHLYQEVQELFPDRYLHIGGDEVDGMCWITNPEIRNFMNKHDLGALDLHRIFIERVIALLRNRPKLIVWKEVFDTNVCLPKDTLVQVWNNGWVEDMKKILTAGNKVLFSASWYLNILSDGFEKLYEADPRLMILDATKNDTIGHDIVGGEACLWGEMADDRNVLSRTWPRASAVAEVLWSAISNQGSGKVLVPQDAFHRIEEHSCRMVRRGIPAEPPNGAGFCII